MFKLKPQPYLVSPDETWKSRSHVLRVSPNLLPNFFFASQHYINIYSQVFRKENICHSSTRNSFVCTFEHWRIMQGLSSSQQKASGKRQSIFFPSMTP